MTYNIEGLRNVYDCEIRAYIEKFDIVLLVETFSVTFPSLIFPLYDVFLSPGLKVSDAVTGRLSGGVALLVKKEISHFVERVETEYDNCVVLKLAKELLGLESDVLLLGTYLPPANSAYYNETEISNGVSIMEECILDLIENVGDLPFILFGDLNARTGSRNAREMQCFYDADYFSVFPSQNTEVEEGDDCFEECVRVSKDREENAFGKYLLNVCEQFDFVIVNGMQGKGGGDGNFTYVSTSGCSVIDYFIVSRNLFSSVSLNVAEKIESKHMPVEMIFLPNDVFVNSECNVSKAVKIEKFVWCDEKSISFVSSFSSEEIQARLRDATELIEVDVNLSLSKFNEAMTMAGECMKKRVYIGKDRQQRWFDSECYHSRTDLRQNLRLFHSGRVDKDCYTEKRSSYNELIRQKKKSHRQSLMESLDKGSSDPKLFWKTIKSLASKVAGVISINTEQWYQHFYNVFNSFTKENNDHTDFVEDGVNRVSDGDDEEEMYDMDALERVITENEVKEAIRVLKNGKAAGPDYLIGEFFKNSATAVVPFLTKYFNKLFTSGLYPDVWTEAIIHPLHKKGDKNNPDNYRGISLLCICSKLYSYILNNRLTNWIEKHEILNESQAGFRRGYSTVDHIFTLQALVQKQLLTHKKLYVAFIDFRKAFDSVVRTTLWKTLKKNGVKGKMYQALSCMYDVVKAKVRSGSDFSDSFMCPRGLKQGEICSPVLFSLLINELANDIVQKGKHGIQLIPDFLEILILMFADDIILISDSVCGLQNQLNILWDSSRRLGLEVNLDKSNIVVFRNGGHLALRERWVYGGHPMSVLNMYKYLGVWLSTRLSFSHTLNDFAAKGKKGVIGILKCLWQLGDRSPAIFFKLFDAQIQPMLSYGAEVWGVEADHTPIERVHLFALKRFLNTSMRTPNAMVYGETGRYPLFINSFVKCIRFWLRILRMPHHRLPSKAYKMLKYLHEQNKKTWASSICYTLYMYGFDEVWENQGVGDERAFLTAFKETLISSYKQTWLENVQGSERFSLYRTFKSTLTLSNYLSDLKHIKARNLLIRLRLGVSPLKVHRFRFNLNATSADLSCPFCCGSVEDEVHFVLVCPKYAELREYYIPRKYTRIPSLFKLTMLFSNTSKPLLLRFSTFVMKALSIRNP